MSFPFVINTDGAAKGRNGEGLASGGFVAYHRDHGHIYTFAAVLGNRTNNYAEYQALIMALNWVNHHMERDDRHILFRTDSQLMEKQLNGQYAINSVSIQQMVNMVRTRLIKLGSYKIEWVPRRENAEADKACNEAIKYGTYEVGSSWSLQNLRRMV
jgi:ribonuclease HI